MGTNLFFTLLTEITAIINLRVPDSGKVTYDCGGRGVVNRGKVMAVRESMRKQREMT